jgi:hypothetical protein
MVLMLTHWTVMSRTVANTLLLPVMQSSFLRYHRRHD